MRVAVIRDEIEQIASSADSISVELNDMTSGETVELTDSLIGIGEGQLSHLFYTQAPILGDRDYRITATGPAGGTSNKQTTVPGRIAFTLNTPTNAQGGSSYIQTITFANLPRRPEMFDIVYTVLRNGTGDPIRVVFQYRELMVEVPTVSGYQVGVRLEHDRVTVMNTLGLPLENETTVLQAVSLEYELLSDEWRVTRDPNDLDFFGSAATYVESWTLSDAVLDDIGYATP